MSDARLSQRERALPGPRPSALSWPLIGWRVVLEGAVSVLVRGPAPQVRRPVGPCGDRGGDPVTGDGGGSGLWGSGPVVEGSPVAGRTGYPCGAPSCRCPACHRPGPSGSAPLTGSGIAPVRTQGREAAPPVAGARRF